jgi:uncharacterized protein (DUF486 family)
MPSITIVEDSKSRKWAVKAIFLIYYGILKKYGFPSLLAILVAWGCGVYFNLPHKLYSLTAVIVGLPIVISLSVIVACPIFYLPQIWLMNSTKIVAKGFIEYGAIKNRNIISWKLTEITPLDGYKKLTIESKSCVGKNTIDILLSPTVDLPKVLSLIENNKKSIA